MEQTVLLLGVVMRREEWSAEYALKVVNYYQHRNYSAYLTQRKRRAREREERLRQRE